MGEFGNTRNIIGSYNTYLGISTSNLNDHSYSTAIGYNARIDSDNQIVLGTNAETTYIPGNLDVSGTVMFYNCPSVQVDNSSSNVLNLATVQYVNSQSGGGGGGGYWALDGDGTSLYPTLNTYKVAIGKTSSVTSSYSLDVVGSVNATSYNATSDYRIKENIIKLLDSNYTVDYLNPVNYINKLTQKEDIGLIAHELQEHYPFLVNGEKDGQDYQSVNYIGLIGVLIKEIQELKKNMQELKQDVSILKLNSK